VILEKPALNPFEIDVRDTLIEHQLEVTPQYGSSGYWIDFAVKHPTQPGRYVLAIECDGASYHSSVTARERDRLRQDQLTRVGWRFNRFWSSEWFHQKPKAVERVLEAYRVAVREADHPSGDDPRHVASEESAVATNETTRIGRAGPRPYVPRGIPIDRYTGTQLVRLIRWIDSDDMLRTEQELLEDAVSELGYQRKGQRIVDTLMEVIRRVRSQS
jgi:very-short-patch-repair endonuclease